MISKEQYGEWRNHPATLFFRQFLKDRARVLGEQAHQAWLNDGAAFEKDSQEARGRILELVGIEDVPFDVIEAFYEEQESGAEDTQAVPG